MLRTSLKQGIEGQFRIDSLRLLADVERVIRSMDGFALVLTHNDKPVGCFMAEMVSHAYCSGNVVQELGVYIINEHRGRMNIERMLEAFLQWGSNRPDVLYTAFNIGQLGPTTPFMRALLERYGFQKTTEGYIKT
jgi:hypothetical protein